MTDSTHTSRTTDWLTPEDLAGEIQVPLRTLYSWRSRSLGPEAVRIGRHLRYPRREVERWLDEQIKRQQSKTTA